MNAAAHFLIFIALAGCSNQGSDPRNIIACGDKTYPPGVCVTSQCKPVPCSFNQRSSP